MWNFRSQNLRKATISFVMSVCPSARKNSATTGRIFVNFDTWEFFEYLSRKFKFQENVTRMTGSLRGNRYKFLIILAKFFLEWEMFQTKVVKKIKTHFMIKKYIILYYIILYYIILYYIILYYIILYYIILYLLLFHRNNVARTRLNVTLNVHCPSCWMYTW